MLGPRWLSLRWQMRLYTWRMKYYRWRKGLCVSCGDRLILWRGELTCTKCNRAWRAAEITDFPRHTHREQLTPWERAEVRRQARNHIAALY